jgi:hypothetical protein
MSRWLLPWAARSGLECPDSLKGEASGGFPFLVVIRHRSAVGDCWVSGRRAQRDSGTEASLRAPRPPAGRAYRQDPRPRQHTGSRAPLCARTMSPVLYHHSGGISPISDESSPNLHVFLQTCGPDGGTVRSARMLRACPKPPTQGARSRPAIPFPTTGRGSPPCTVGLVCAAGGPHFPTYLYAADLLPVHGKRQEPPVVGQRHDCPRGRGCGLPRHRGVSPRPAPGRGTRRRCTWRRRWCGGPGTCECCSAGIRSAWREAAGMPEIARWRLASVGRLRGCSWFS